MLLWRVQRRERLCVCDREQHGNLPACLWPDAVIIHQPLIDCKGRWGHRGPALFLFTEQDAAVLYLMSWDSRFKPCRLEIRHKWCWLCYKLCVRNLVSTAWMARNPREQLECQLPSQRKSVKSTVNCCTSLWFSQVVCTCRLTDQPITVCLCKISLGWGDLGNQSEHERTTAACWNNRERHVGHITHRGF